MFTLTRLAVGLEPLSVPDATGTVSPNSVAGNIWVPRWPESVRPLSRQRTKQLLAVGGRKVKQPTAAPQAQAVGFASHDNRSGCIRGSCCGTPNEGDGT